MLEVPVNTYYVYVIKPVNTDRCYIGASINFLRELERWVSHDADYFPNDPPERIVRCFKLPDCEQKDARQFKQFLTLAQVYGLLEQVLELFIGHGTCQYISILDFIRLLRPRNPAYTFARVAEKHIVTLDGKRIILRGDGTYR